MRRFISFLVKRAGLSSRGSLCDQTTAAFMEEVQDEGFALVLNYGNANMGLLGEETTWMKAETLVGVGGRHPVLGARELSGSEEEMEPESMGTGPGHIARQGPEWSSQSRTSPSLTEAASFSKCSRGLINSAPSPENPEPGWQAGG